MNYKQALTQVYQYIEEDHVEKAVMGCLRIARHSKDYVNAAMFLRELYPDKEEAARVLFDDTVHLKEEARKFIWKVSLERWIKLHTIEFGVPPGDDEKEKILLVSAGEIQPELEQWDRTIRSMVVPPGLHPVHAASFLDGFIRQRSQMELRVKALLTIKSRIKARCLNYAIQIEKQLELQHESQGFLDEVQNEVNNLFKERSEDVFRKLQKAVQLSLSRDPEDAALALTEVRRTLKAAADYFFPPVEKPVLCSDGQERRLDNERYMNRLQEFLARQFGNSTASDLLRKELDLLSSYMRRLNDIASKGVHASVTLAEARQGLVGLYLFLFNVNQHLNNNQLI